MNISCPQCGSDDTTLQKPAVYVCEVCEFVFEAEYDEQKFQCIEQRLDALEERILRIEREEITKEEDEDDSSY